MCQGVFGENATLPNEDCWVECHRKAWMLLSRFEYSHRPSIRVHEARLSNLAASLLYPHLLIRSVNVWGVCVSHDCATGDLPTEAKAQWTVRGQHVKSSQVQKLHK